MYKRLVVGLVALGSLFLFATPVRADAQNFSISSFTADYYLNSDTSNVSQMYIREEIVAQFPEFDQNHGILRAIPNSYDGHSLELSVKSVKKPSGEAWQFESSEQNGNTVLKIGDPDAYVRGAQTFVIEYAVRGPVSFGESDRLFWDVNGDQWPQKFNAVTARIHIPAKLAAATTSQPTCVTGVFGAQGTDCRAEVTSEGENKIVTVSTTRQLGAHETLTFAIPFASGTFQHYAMSPQETARIALLALAIATPPIITAFFVMRYWRKHGRDAKANGVIIPQYLPPKNVSVLGASAVLHQGFQPKAVSATILDLAVRHYIKIYETGKTMFSGYEYDIELVKPTRGLLPEEIQVVHMLFADSKVGSRVSLKELSKTLYQEASKLGGTVEAAMTDAGYFVQSPTKARTPFIAAGIIMAIGGVFFIPYTLGLIVAGAICLIGAIFMAAPTLKGAELKAYLHGLKMYMKLAESERLAVLQSPDGRLTEKVDVANKGQLIKLYERLLPYAVVFGIEKKWAKEFADLYESQPEWYSGTGTFNAVYFAGALSSLDTTMTQSFSPPSSSGSGAGGGGGGGGGGGW